MKRKEVIHQIKRAIHAAEMSNASFGMGDSGKKLTDEIRETTRLYRETWIIAPLRNALAELENGK